MLSAQQNHQSGYSISSLNQISYSSILNKINFSFHVIIKDFWPLLVQNDRRVNYRSISFPQILLTGKTFKFFKIPTTLPINWQEVQL